MRIIIMALALISVLASVALTSGQEFPPAYEPTAYIQPTVDCITTFDPFCTPLVPTYDCFSQWARDTYPWCMATVTPTPTPEPVQAQIVTYPQPSPSQLTGFLARVAQIFSNAQPVVYGMAE